MYCCICISLMKPGYIILIVLFSLTLISFAGLLIFQYVKSKSEKKSEPHSVNSKPTSSNSKMVLYHHKQCSWCHKLMPIFDKLCTELSLDCEKIDVSVPSNKSKVPKNLQGFPTILHPDSKKMVAGYMEYEPLKRKLQEMCN